MRQTASKAEAAKKRICMETGRNIYKEV